MYPPHKDKGHCSIWGVGSGGGIYCLLLFCFVEREWNTVVQAGLELCVAQFDLELIAIFLPEPPECGILKFWFITFNEPKKFMRTQCSHPYVIKGHMASISASDVSSSSKTHSVPQLSLYDFYVTWKGLN